MACTMFTQLQIEASAKLFAENVIKSMERGDRFYSFAYDQTDFLLNSCRIIPITRIVMSEHFYNALGSRIENMKIIISGCNVQIDFPI
jgi:hypothetical protein